MMSCLVFCNIGARDVQLDESGRMVELRPTREWGERILADYSSYAGQIVLPIIEPCVRYILSASGNRLVKVILFGTDQESGEFSHTDTLHFAEIARRKLAERINLPEVEVQAVLIQHANPAYYDEAYEAFGCLIREYPMQAADQYYVILAGGTPACNTALLLQGVRRFGQALQAVYIPPRKDPILLRVGMQIENSFLEAAALEHLRRLDFANALPFMKGLNISPGLTELVEYAAQRYDFDFPAAKRSLETAIRDGSPAVRVFCAGIRHELDVIPASDDDAGNLMALLKELYWNASITYGHKRYADFLGRVYRLQEAILRYLVESIYHLSTDLSPKYALINQQNWESGISSNSRLLEYLEARFLNNKQLNWRMIGRPTYKAMLSFACDEQKGRQPDGTPVISRKEFERMKACISKVNALDKLVELRHRTIIGHGFKGVSEKDIIAASPEQRPPLEVLSEIMKILTQQKLQNSIFELTADFVVRQMKMEG